MTMGNAYIEQRQKELRINAAMVSNVWKQFMCDIWSEVLHDPGILGDDRQLPADVIMHPNQIVEERVEYYRPALGTDLSKDADVKRSQLDRSMEAIIEEYRESHPKDTEPFHPFEERYPEVDPITYDKPVRDNHRHPATKKHRKR